MKKKSQIVVYDFMLGFLIFLVVILIAVIYWYNATSQQNYDLEFEKKINLARDVSQMLVLSGGKPERWENYALQTGYGFSCLTESCILGLAVDDDVISQEKLNAFLELSNYNYDYGYNRTRQLLNLGKYNFYFSLKNLDNTVINSTGKMPQSNMSVSIRRIVTLNKEKRIIDFVIY